MAKFRLLCQPVFPRVMKHLLGAVKTLKVDMGAE